LTRKAKQFDAWQDNLEGELGRPGSLPFAWTMISSLVVMCPCSLVILRILPGSASHLKLFDHGKSSVYLLDLALRVIFFFARSADIRLSLGDTPS
jgi:hypothetical protein